MTTVDYTVRAQSDIDIASSMGSSLKVNDFRMRSQSVVTNHV